MASSSTRVRMSLVPLAERAYMFLDDSGHTCSMNNVSALTRDFVEHLLERRNGNSTEWIYDAKLGRLLIKCYIPSASDMETQWLAKFFLMKVKRTFPKHLSEVIDYRLSTTDLSAKCV